MLELQPATAGMIFRGDVVPAGMLLSIGLVLAGVVGLNLSGVTLSRSSQVP